MHVKSKLVVLVITASFVFSPLGALALTTGTTQSTPVVATTAAATDNAAVIALLQQLIALLTQELKLLLAQKAAHTTTTTTPTSSTSSTSGSETSTPIASSGGGGGSTSAPAPTPTPSPAPTVILSASSASITAGQSVTLSWTSTNATGCSSTLFSTPGTSGSTTIYPTQTTTFSITCTGAGGTASAITSIQVTPQSPISNPVSTGTIYYVNFADGSDTAAGTSQTTAWKHAPGDPAATGNPKAAKLIGGDEVLFKGGVIYQGSIGIPASGTAGKPITYEGTGWGSGSAILSGQTFVQATFAAFVGNPSLSVATLPVADVPNQFSVVDIDGHLTWMSNTSTSTNPHFIDNAASKSPNATSYPVSEMVGSGTSWTLTDEALGKYLASLDQNSITSIILRAYGYPQIEYNMAIAGFSTTTNAVRLTGSFSPATVGSYTLINNPAFISASNPYSEFAIEGDQFISAVTPGTHTVAVSTLTDAINVTGRSNITIDGFTITGYGGNPGVSIRADGVAQNLTITNNTIIDSTSAGASTGAQATIGVADVTNLVITGNHIGPLTNSRGIYAASDVNVDISHNTITQPGFSAIDSYANQNVSIRFNSISDMGAVHAEPIAIYDTAAGRNQHVTVMNNEINNVVNCGLTYEGLTVDPSISNDLTIADNVITNATACGIADWGNENGVKISGNIVLSLPGAMWAVSPGPNSRNTSYVDNIWKTYSYVSPTISPSITYTDNVAFTTPSPANVPKTGNNIVNAALAPIVTQALSAGSGTLPASICSILMPGTSGTIGINYQCK